MTAVHHQVKRTGRMRVSKAKAAQNREHILTTAARLFRENGIRATGVDAISRRAGVTHGGFYSQFESKEAVAAEAIRLALSRWRYVWRRAADGKGRREAFRSIVTGYLSPEHRPSAAKGASSLHRGAEGCHGLPGRAGARGPSRASSRGRARGLRVHDRRSHPGARGRRPAVVRPDPRRCKQARHARRTSWKIGTPRSP